LLRLYSFDCWALTLSREGEIISNLIITIKLNLHHHCYKQHLIISQPGPYIETETDKRCVSSVSIKYLLFLFLIVLALWIWKKISCFKIKLKWSYKTQQKSPF
jgi:hypothetical protein